MNNEITKRLIEMMSEVKNDKELLSIATPETNFAIDIGFDSLQMVNLFLSIEEEYNVEFDFDEFDYEAINTIEKLSALIESLM